MKQNLFNKLWLRVGMIVAIMTTALSGTAWADTEVTYNFSEIEGFSDWTTSYSQHVVSYNEATVTFASANHQTSTITDIPVTKGGAVELALNNDYSSYALKSATFTCRQWGSKAQTITLHYSTDGGNTYTSTGVTSTNFTISSSSLPEGTNAVKITFSSTSNQVGIASATITYAPNTSSAVATTTTIDATGITNTDVYTSTAAGSLSASVAETASGNAVAGATVTWSGNNDDVATIDASTGAITLVGAGSVTFTATYAGVSGSYLGSSATYVMTVTDSTPFTGGEVTFVCGTDVSETTSITKDGVTMTMTSGVWNRTDNYRLYANQSLTISTESGTITSIVFTISQNNFTGDGYDAETKTWTGNASSVTLTADGGQVRFTPVVVTVDLSATPDPSISADDVNIAYDDEEGEIEYTISNPVSGGSIVASSTSDWLEVDGTAQTTSTGTFEFICDTNPVGTQRTAEVTLTYTFNTGTLTKTVIVTQAGNPDALVTIAEARAQTGTVKTKGIVTSCVGTTAFIQDATAAICVYGSELTVGDEVRVVGTITTYKGLVEITDPAVTVLSQNNTVTPEVMTIAQVNASTKQGWLVKVEDATVTVIGSNNNYTIAQGENTITLHGALGTEVSVNDIITFNGNIGCFNSVQIVNPTDVTVTGSVTPTGNTVTLGTQTNVASVEMWIGDNDLTDIVDGAEVEEGTVVFVKPTAAVGYEIENVTVEAANSTPVTVTKNTGNWSFVMPNSSVTVNITAVQSSVTPPTPITGDKYVKVISTDDLTDGQYLIVYEEDGIAFNGGLETLDAAHNTIEVVFNNSEIAATSATTAAEFTIDVTAGTILSASGKYIGKTAYANGMDSSESTAYTNTFAIETNGDAVITASGGCTLRFNNASGDNNYRFRYYKSGQQAIQLYKKVETTPTSQTVTVTNAGYATIVAEADLEIPAGVEVFAVTVNGAATSAHLEAITGGIPSGAAVLVKASAGEYVFNSAAEEVDAISSNDLVAATTDVTADGTQYCLAKKNDNVGFYKVQAGIVIPAGKAYLVVSNGVKAFYGFDDDDATAISSVESFTEEGAIYNVAGQRLQKMQKGINIVNGKKILK